jgi:hypothetical protein
MGIMTGETVSLPYRFVDTAMLKSFRFPIMAGITEFFLVIGQQPFITSNMRVMTGGTPIPGHRRMDNLIFVCTPLVTLKTDRLPKTDSCRAQPRKH